MCFLLLDCEEFEVICRVVQTIAAEVINILEEEKETSNNLVLEISHRQQRYVTLFIGDTCEPWTLSLV